MPDDARMDVIVMGRFLGTSDGWDGDPGENLIFYDFRPEEGVDIKPDDICINFEKGLIVTYDDAGEETSAIDIVPILAKLPVRTI